MTELDPHSPAPTPYKRRIADGSLVFLLAFLAATAGACYALKGPAVFWETLEEQVRLVVALIPVVVGACLLGAFVQVLIPPAVIRRQLGQGSGVRGMLVAVAIGLFIPGGPMISMPLLMAVLDAGAELATCVTFYLSWSLLALTRLIQWELPLMGAKFATIRFLASVPLPLIAGFTAVILLRRMPIPRDEGSER